MQSRLGKATIILGIITIALFCYQNHLIRKTLEETQRQITNDSEQFLIENRPIILIGDSMRFGWPLDYRKFTTISIKNSGKGPAVNVHVELCVEVSKGFYQRFLKEQTLPNCYGAGKWGPVAVGPGESKNARFFYPKETALPGYDTLYFRFRVRYQSHNDTTQKGLESYGYFPPPGNDEWGKFVGAPLFIRDSIW